MPRVLPTGVVTCKGRRGLLVRKVLTRQGPGDSSSNAEERFPSEPFVECAPPSTSRSSSMLWVPFSHWSRRGDSGEPA